MMSRTFVLCDGLFFFAIGTLLLSTGTLSAEPPIATRKAAHSSQDDLLLVHARYRQWLLDGPSADYAQAFVRHQYEATIHRAETAQRTAAAIDFHQPAGLYDTRKMGSDRREIFQLVTEVLPYLSIAYHLRGPRDDPSPLYHDPQTLALLIRVFDRLHDRGFRGDMQMPWHANEARTTDPPTAIIADFHLRTAGYALATLLMRDDLQAADKLERSLQTCKAIFKHGEKTGDLSALKLNADGVRVAVNFVLPYALATNDPALLMHLKRQLDRSMAVESDASDTIKPDGLGFHHLGVYLAGYAPYAVSEAAFMAWLLRDTAHQLAPETIANLRKSLLILRIVSQKYDMHKALAGRLRPIGVIPDVMLGYAYLAALEESGDRHMNRALVRLCDEAFLQSEMAMRPFKEHRDEVPPGPGAVGFFFRTLTVANDYGPEPEPNGHWALNYGPLSVHRRRDWMVSVKGFSKYLWAFERSITDALGERRLQNVLGFHDSSCAIRIYCRGKPVSARESGYVSEGWDWCHQPGATVRLIPAQRLLQMDRLGKRFNRPFGLSSFAGGVSLAGRHGLFSMQYAEVSCDGRDPPLQANKSLFFFDDQIVVLTSDIRNGDGVFPVGTTLYQCHLSEPQIPTWVQSRQVVGLGQEERFAGGDPLLLVDPVGNGYYIPRAKNVVVSRRLQESLDYTATTKTVGAFATAWFDHGVNPHNADCEYVILVRAEPKKLRDFVAHASDYYRVLQRDSIAHIVAHRKLGLTGYALFRANTVLRQGVIAQVDTPCMVLTQNESGPVMCLGVCNPDFGWQYGLQYAFRHKDRSPTAVPALARKMPVQITVRGVWRLRGEHKEVTVRPGERSTVVQVDCSAAQSIELELQRDGTTADHSAESCGWGLD